MSSLASCDLGRETPTEIKSLAKRFKYCLALNFSVDYSVSTCASNGSLCIRQGAAANPLRGLLEDRWQWRKGIVGRKLCKGTGCSSRGAEMANAERADQAFGDEKVADAVIKRKEDIEELHAEIRDHPELPGNFSEY